MGTTDRQPHDGVDPDGGSAPEVLAAAVARAAAAGLAVADVTLQGPGRAFEPSRGRPGQRYGAHEISVRELTHEGSGALASGVSLYPPPPEEVRRVIVLPLEHSNWLAHSEALERAVAQLADRPPDR
jgi:hypothetical protein